MPKIASPTRDNSSIPASAWSYILLFFCITFISAALESGYYFMLPYLAGIGISAGELGGVVMGVCYGVSFSLRPFIPIAEQRFGGRILIRFGYGCFFVSAAGVAFFAGTVKSVILWRAVAGVGFGIVGIMMTAYERQFIPENIRGRSIGLISTAYNLPSLIVVPAMEFLISEGFFKSYIFFFPLLVMAGIAAIRRLPPLPAENAATHEYGETEEKASYLVLLKRPQIIFFIISAMLFALTDAGQLRFVQLAQERGVAASYFFSVSAGTALLFRIIFGHLIDRLPRKLCAPVSTAVTAAMMFTMTFVSTPTMLMLCGFIFGLAMGFGYPAFMCLTIDLGGRRYVTRLAVLFGLLYSSQFFITPIIMEFLIRLAGDAAGAYRLLYGAVFLAAATLVPLSPRVYRTKA